MGRTATKEGRGRLVEGLKRRERQGGGWDRRREREEEREGEGGREEWEREGKRERERGRNGWRGLKPAVETWGMRRQARPPPPHLASLLRHASPHNAPD